MRERDEDREGCEKEDQGEEEEKESEKKQVRMMVERDDVEASRKKGEK